MLRVRVTVLSNAVPTAFCVFAEFFVLART